MKKIYVLDTSVYLADPNALYSFKNHDIAVPIKVLEEIDKHKKRQDAIGSNARQVIRNLDSLREKGSLIQGVRIAKLKGKIKVVSSKLANLPVDLNADIADNKIIACALRLTQDEPSKKIVLVSRDVNMRVIANSLGIVSEDFNPGHVVETRENLFSGVSKIELEDEEITSLFSNPSGVYLENTDLLPNEFTEITSKTQGTSAGFGRYDLKSRSLVSVQKNKNSKIFGIRPKNDEQNLAMELLMNPDIPIVTLVGKAGSGKTLCAIAAGLHQVLETQDYKRLVVSRPVQSVGKDIGFLPGTLEEKMLPWLKPIQDNIEFLLGDKRMFEDFLDRGTIEMEAISHIRGRSIPDTFMIIDEAQNLTAHELKTIITRVGEKTKIVLTGDIEQVDNIYLDETSNGLSYAVEKFKNSELAGHILLRRGERSAVATLAADIL